MPPACWRSPPSRELVRSYQRGTRCPLGLVAIAALGELRVDLGEAQQRLRHLEYRHGVDCRSSRGRRQTGVSVPAPRPAPHVTVPCERADGTDHRRWSRGDDPEGAASTGAAYRRRRHQPKPCLGSGGTLLPRPPWPSVLAAVPAYRRRREPAARRRRRRGLPAKRWVRGPCALPDAQRSYDWPTRAGCGLARPAPASAPNGLPETTLRVPRGSQRSRAP